MSKAGGYLSTASSIFAAFSDEKAHSSITDWIEVLSSDRYDELSLDGIPELVESINILASAGTTEAARAIRKKLKYGNVHRQVRALVILRALTENAGRGFQLNWADEMIVSRLREMANDNLLDPKVKKRLILVFHAWSIHYKEEPRMREVAGLYAKYGHAAGTGPELRKASHIPTSNVPHEFNSRSSGGIAYTKKRSTAFADTEDLYSHDWAPSKRGPDTYADLAQAKADVARRQAERDRQIQLEQREAELERKEREHRRQQDMAALESRRKREADEEAERRRKAKEAKHSRPANAPAPQKPKFDLAKERPQILVAVANAIQTAAGLVAACRHINREYENILESPRVQEALDKAKAARRVIIRYLQLVMEENLVGTLLEANERVVEAIQLYDKLSKPAALDSDSEGESAPKPKEARKDSNDIGDLGMSEHEVLNARMHALKLEADRKGELQKLQDRQRKESQKRAAAPPRPAKPAARAPANVHADLQDLDFGSISSNKQSRSLAPPLSPDSEDGSYGGGSLSDFSDYDSSDSEYRAAQSRSRRNSTHHGNASHSRKSSTQYKSLDDDYGSGSGRRANRDARAFDPFADDDDTPVQEKKRMQWAEI